MAPFHRREHVPPAPPDNTTGLSQGAERETTRGTSPGSSIR